MAPVQERTPLDPHVRGANDHAIALALALEYRLRRTGEGHGLVDAERTPVLAGRQAPLLVALGLQRQIGDRLRRTERAARQQAGHQGNDRSTNVWMLHIPGHCACLPRE
ncbi:hypothetical protein FQZ97_1178440 [compost metagenome]